MHLDELRQKDKQREKHNDKKRQKEKKGNVKETEGSKDRESISCGIMGKDESDH